MIVFGFSDWKGLEDNSNGDHRLRSRHTLQCHDVYEDESTVTFLVDCHLLDAKFTSWFTVIW